MGMSMAILRVKKNGYVFGWLVSVSKYSTYM